MTLESNSQITDALIANAETIVNSRNERRRAEQRRRRAERGQREGNRAAAQEFLDQDTRDFRTKAGLTDTERELQLGSQISVDIDDEAWAFGEDPSYMGGDRRGQDDEQTYSRDEKIRYETLADDFVSDIEELEKTEATRRDAGTTNQQAGMRDALLRLQEGKDKFSPGYDAFGAEGAVMAAVDARLSEELDPTLRAERERAVVREMVQADNAQGNPFTQARNYLKAEAEAEGYRNRDGGLPRQLADEDIGRIEEIRSLGGATPFASHDAVGNFQVVRAVQPGAFTEAVPLYDKDGNIREYYGAEDGAMVQLGEVNIDSSDQALNAPRPTPGQEFVSRNLPAYGKPGATTFGFPQVGINDELALLGERVRALKGYGLEGMGDPRSISDFEKVMSGIVGRAQKRGDAFFTRDPQTGKQVAVPNPGVDDVLAKLGYSPNDKERLANALYQGQAARVVDVNTDDKRAFYGRYDSPRASSEVDINFDSAELRPDGGLQLQKLGNEKVGRGKAAKSAKAGLVQQISLTSKEQAEDGRRRPMAGTRRPVVGRAVNRRCCLPEAARAIAGAQEARNDAQMPLIAQLANEDSERARFVKGDDRNLTEVNWSQNTAEIAVNKLQKCSGVPKRTNSSVHKPQVPTMPWQGSSDSVKQAFVPRVDSRYLKTSLQFSRHSKQQSQRRFHLIQA